MTLSTLEALELAATKGPWANGEEHEFTAHLTCGGTVLAKFERAMFSGHPHTINRRLTVALRNSAPDLLALARAFQEWDRAAKDGDAGGVVTAVGKMREAIGRLEAS